MNRFDECDVIHVDFQRGEIVDVNDREVGQLWDEYHQAVANGGVDFPLVEEGFDALFSAVFAGGGR